MINILSMSVSDINTAGIMALVSNDGSSPKQALVFHAKSVLRTMGRLLEELDNNKYRNREIQEKYNRKEIDIVLLSSVDLSSVPNDDVKDLLLRVKTLEECTKLHEHGYELLNVYAPINLEVKTEIVPRYWAITPQVVVQTARGKKYYVQKLFKDMSEAEAYMTVTSIDQVLKDTDGIKKPYKEPVKVDSNG